MSGYGRPTSVVGLVLALVIGMTLVYMGLRIAGEKFSVGPLAPTPAPTVEALPSAVPTPAPPRIIDYGRLTGPVAGTPIDEGGPALIVFMSPGSTVDSQVQSLDEIALGLVQPGDRYIYFFDTRQDGSLYVVLRCPVENLGTPQSGVNCAYAIFNDDVPYQTLYDSGFVSSMP